MLNQPLDQLSCIEGLEGYIAPGETDRPWGRPIAMSEAVKRRIDALWDSLGIMSGQE